MDRKIKSDEGFSFDFDRYLDVLESTESVDPEYYMTENVFSIEMKTFNASEQKDIDKKVIEALGKIWDTIQKDMPKMIDEQAKIHKGEIDFGSSGKDDYSLEKHKEYIKKAIDMVPREKFIKEMRKIIYNETKEKDTMIFYIDHKKLMASVKFPLLKFLIVVVIVVAGATLLNSLGFLFAAILANGVAATASHNFGDLSASLNVKGSGKKAIDKSQFKDLFAFYLRNPFNKIRKGEWTNSNREFMCKPKFRINI